MTRWEVISPHLTSEEQVNFIAAYAKQHPNWVKEDLNGEAKGDDLKPHIAISRAFHWATSPNGFDYWQSIRDRIKDSQEGGQL